MIVIGTVLLAAFNPYVIGVAVLVGLAIPSSSGIWLGAILGGLAFRITYFLPVFLPFNGFVDIGMVILGLMAAFFWAAFANRSVRPRLETIFRTGSKL